MTDIHERLREIRNGENLSRRAFAKAVESRTGYSVSHSSVGQYETGTTVPSTYSAAVCDAFGVNPRWLLKGEGIRHQASPSQMEAALARIAGALRALRAARSGEDEEAVEGGSG